MRAILQYANGASRTLEGQHGSDLEIVEDIVESYSPVKIWLLMDEEDPSCLGPAARPDWLIRTVCVTRADKSAAKVFLPCFKGDDLWSAFWREYPESYWTMTDDSILSEDTEIARLDEWFDPSQDEDLSKWLRTIHIEVAEYDPQGQRSILRTIEGDDDAPDATAVLSDMAVEWTIGHIKKTGRDTSPDIRVEIGGETVWSLKEETAI